MIIQPAKFLLKAYQTIIAGSIRASIKFSMDRPPTDCKAKITTGQNAKIQEAKTKRDLSILG